MTTYELERAGEAMNIFVESELSKFGQCMALVQKLEMNNDLAISKLSQIKFDVAWGRMDVGDHTRKAVKEFIDTVGRRYEDSMIMAGAKRLMEALEARERADEAQVQTQRTWDSGDTTVDNRLRDILSWGDGNYDDDGRCING